MPRPTKRATHASPLPTCKIGMAARICVAQIGGAHGIRGEVKLKAFTADPMAVKDYAPLESEDGAASFVIEALRPGQGPLLARAADESYHVDLIGLRAVTVEGHEIGTVLAVHDFGAGDILELRLAES